MEKEVITKNDNFVIQINNLTKEYASGVGVFDININVKAGEVYGFIGPNGAGKSTTIRQMVGFIKPNQGEITINNKNAWHDTEQIMNELGYVSGELLLPDYMTGISYLKSCAAIRKNVDWQYVQKLINYLEFDPKRRIKKMSKGMKQKVALIAAFMHKPKVLILDEPTSGLDPLMQEKFLKIIKELKAEGATVFLSSHIFSEIQSIADRFAIIKAGKIVSEVSMRELSNMNDKVYIVQFATKNDCKKFTKLSYKCEVIDEQTLRIVIAKGTLNQFISDLTAFNLESVSEEAYNLEDHFLKFYGGEVNDKF